MSKSLHNRLGDVSDTVASLPDRPLAELKALWLQCFGTAAPPFLRKAMLALCIAYRLQEKALGGLSPASRRRLREVASDLEQGKTPHLANAPRIKPGTRLIRTWQGEVHEVTVGDQGYRYRGEKYSSLSEIARLITGTRWSGPAFFGLRGRRGTSCQNQESSP